MTPLRRLLVCCPWGRRPLPAGVNPAGPLPLLRRFAPNILWRRSRVVHVIAAACAALALSVRDSDATTVVALTNAELSRGARTVLHGRVAGKTAHVAAEGGRIYTEYRFEVDEMLKGAAGADGTVTFREWGGEKDGVRYWIPGLKGYRMGEEVVTFLGDPDATTGIGFTFGLAQGKFTVDRDGASGKATVRRELEGLKLVPRGAAAEPEAQARPAPTPAFGRDLSDFLGEIRAEVRK